MTRENRKSEAERRAQALELAESGQGLVLDGERVSPREIMQMVSVRLEPDLVSSLREIAIATGTSLSELVREAAARLVSDRRRELVVFTEWTAREANWIAPMVMPSKAISYAPEVKLSGVARPSTGSTWREDSWREGVA